ncbi:MAG: LysM peptidoglycan-binding domain-containing protein [Chloroflexi bacterium]|nr:LysM peptidoglycan-binding domain-containing protein [Chloroflexota bacterium]
MEADLGRRLLEPETRSPDPTICPFLRATGDGGLAEPVPRPDDTNRCLADGPPMPQDLAWQATTCLATAHITCLRYLSGSSSPGLPAGGAEANAGEAAAAATAPQGAADAVIATDAGIVADADRPPSYPPMVDLSQPTRMSATMTPAVVLSLVLLVASAAGAITFVAATGGLALPTAGPSAVAVASASPTATASAVPTPGATGTATATPTGQPSPIASPTTAPSAGLTPAPTSSRYALLTPCPSTPACYHYTVRVGDNLRSIANYFGVPYETILARNPAIPDPARIQPGTVLTLPPPTR